MKAAHVALSSDAWQEIRVRFGPTARRGRRDDKGRGDASMESGCSDRERFPSPWWAAGPHGDSVVKHFQEGSAELQIPPRQAGQAG
jgi:hypothetical protein